MLGPHRMSEAASIALHTMSYLAAKDDSMVPVGRIAKDLRMSGNHLSKVLQRLVKAKLVESIRGPKGGFRLSRDPDEITLNDVYEVIEGPFSPADCLYGEKACDNDECIFHGLIGSVNWMFSEYLNNTRLSDVASKYRRNSNGDKENN